MVSVTGWLVSTTWAPLCGLAGVGGPIDTPGMGPATDGLNGFELLVDWQPSASASSGNHTNAKDFFILQPRSAHAHGSRRRATSCAILCIDRWARAL